MLAAQGKISRADVADLCVALLSGPEATDATFEVKSTVPFSEAFQPAPGQQPTDWAALLRHGGLKPRVTGKTIDGRYMGKEADPDLLPPEIVEESEALM